MVQSGEVQQSVPPQSDKNCPDPTGPYTSYQVDAAAGQEESTLYVADAPEIEQRYKALDGAQAKYDVTQKAQKAAYGDLVTRLGRIKETLHCDLKGTTDVADLQRCWENLVKQTSTSEQSLDCDPVDKLFDADLPSEIDRLRALVGLAVACAGRADKAFDRLAKVPETLGQRITDLGTATGTLEQAIAATGSDPRRSFVEYLRLNKDLGEIADDWCTPLAYGCKLKRVFQTLLRRHVTTIRIKIAVTRYDKRAALEDEAKEAKKKNLTDLVLECASPKNPTSGPKPGQSTGPCESVSQSPEPGTVEGSTPPQDQAAADQAQPPETAEIV